MQLFGSKYFCLWGKKLKCGSWQCRCGCISQGIKSTFEKGQRVITLALEIMANSYVKCMDDAFIISF